MKIKSTMPAMLMLATTLTAVTVPAQAGKWYVGAALSSIDVDSIDTSSTQAIAGVTRNLNIGSDSDTGINLKIGKTVLETSSGALDIELNYAQSDHDVENIQFQNILFFNGAAEGELEADSLTLRAAYKFKTGTAFQPYVGVGLGLLDLSVDARYGGSIGTAPQSQPPFATGSDEALTVEFRVGTEFKFSDNWVAFAEYSYTNVDDVNFSRLGGGPGGLASTTQEGDFDFDAFTIGLNYKF